MYYSYGFDWVLIIITFIITLGSQFYINSKYSHNRKILTKKGYSGRDVARKILDKNGLGSVSVVEVSGMLSDHYDPRGKVVRLSSDIYNNSSIASVSVAAHECGHAIQDKDGYFFLRFRSSIIPFVNIASSAGYIAIVIGLFAGALNFIRIGIFFELIILFFQIITLPVEFNASRRGLAQLEDLGILNKDELSKSRGMLIAAALTYVAAVATSLLEIIRLILIAGRDER